MAVACQEGECADLAVVVVDQAVISAPVPVSNEHFIAWFGIIVHDMVQDAGAARCCAGIDVSFRTGLAEALIDTILQEFIIALDRSICAEFRRCQVLQFLLDDIKNDEASVFIKNGSYCALVTFSTPISLASAIALLLAAKMLSSALFPFACGAAILYILTSSS